jgi:hypothetical protein
MTPTIRKRVLGEGEHRAEGSQVEAPRQVRRWLHEHERGQRGRGHDRHGRDQASRNDIGNVGERQHRHGRPKVAEGVGRDEGQDARMTANDP